MCISISQLTSLPFQVYLSDNNHCSDSRSSVLRAARKRQDRDSLLFVRLSNLFSGPEFSPPACMVAKGCNCKVLGIHHFNIHCLSEKYTSVVLAIFYFTSEAEDGSIGLVSANRSTLSLRSPLYVKCRDSGPRPAVPARVRVWSPGTLSNFKCPPDHIPQRSSRKEMVLTRFAAGIKVSAMFYNRIYPISLGIPPRNDFYHNFIAQWITRDVCD